jgi:hypothetical protein
MPLDSRGLTKEKHKAQMDLESKLAKRLRNQKENSNYMPRWSLLHFYISHFGCPTPTPILGKMKVDFLLSNKYYPSQVGYPISLKALHSTSEFLR